MVMVTKNPENKMSNDWLSIHSNNHIRKRKLQGNQTETVGPELERKALKEQNK